MTPMQMVDFIMWGTMLLLFGLLLLFLDMTVRGRWPGGWTQMTFETLKVWVVSHRPPDLIIYDRAAGQGDNQYLRRWYLIPRNRGFNIYLHHFLRSDNKIPHDHPWPSLSLMLSGFVHEDQRLKDGQIKTTTIAEGQWKFRKPSYAHVVRVPPVLIDKEGAWTLFITGPRLRSWGFWCPKGWRSHQEFVAANDPGRIGNGCE